MDFFGETLEGLKDLFGFKDDEPEPEQKPDQPREAVAELLRLTTDDTEEKVQQRSLAVYLAVVRHVRAGGTVKFITPQGKIRTLKVRLR